MEDYAWLVFVAIFWIMSSVGEMRKAKRKNRQRETEPMTPPRPRRPSREPAAQTGPQAGRRELGRDLDEAARRAEDALRRWEARQTAQRETMPTLAPTPISPRPAQRRPRRETQLLRRGSARAGGYGGPRERRAEEERREAYEAIAGMLSGREPESEPRDTPAVPAEPTTWDNTARHKHDDLPPPARVAPAEEAGGLARLDRLPVLQRAILLSEILGRPKALRPGSDLL